MNGCSDNNRNKEDINDKVGIFSLTWQYQQTFLARPIIWVICVLHSFPKTNDIPFEEIYPAP